MTNQIAQWYEQQTGLNAKQGAERIKKIEAFMKKYNVGLGQIQIYTRSINTKYGYKPLVEKEGREKIGSTNHSSKRGTEYYVEIK